MTTKHLSSRFVAAGILAVAFLAWSGAIEARRQNGPDAPRAVLHVLNRLAFGPRPGDVERVQAMGIGAYIEQQLHPERLPDEALNARLATFETVSLSSEVLTEKYFVPAQMARRDQQLKLAKADAKRKSRSSMNAMADDPNVEDQAGPGVAGGQGHARVNSGGERIDAGARPALAMSSASSMKCSPISG